jgi:hypothetical protein
LFDVNVFRRLEALTEEHVDLIGFQQHADFLFPVDDGRMVPPHELGDFHERHVEFVFEDVHEDMSEVGDGAVVVVPNDIGDVDVQFSTNRVEVRRALGVERAHDRFRGRFAVTKTRAHRRRSQ